jgi:RNA polymerase sigma factor (sigma-70 family)
MKEIEKRTDDQTSIEVNASIDTRLVEKALHEGADSFRPIVERYKGAVFAVALSRVRDFHLAEDVAQQVFLEAYQKLDSIKDPARLGGWLRTIAARRSVNAIRSNRKEVEIQPDGSDGLLIGDANEDLEREDLKRRVAGAIGCLRKGQRETTVLFYIEGYSIGEIASILDIPPGTVKRRLHDARAKLKSEMLGLVKDTLTSEKPSDDFDDQVYTMIRQYAMEPTDRWWEVQDRIVALDLDGVEGLQKAFTSPHGNTRVLVPKLIVGFHRKAAQDDRREVLVDLLKSCLKDPNKNVRWAAVPALFFLDVPEERKHSEFVPLVLDLLEDRSRWIRRKAAYTLQHYAEHVPLERAALALADVGPDEWSRRTMSRLVREVIKRKA